VVGASLLPFPIATGARAPERPVSSTGGRVDDFAGTMDDALGADRLARRADNGARSPRRAEPARSRDLAQIRDTAPSRREAAARPQARTAERADERVPDDADAERVAARANDGTAAVDQADAPQTEAKPAGGSAEPAAAGDADAAVAAPVEEAAGNAAAAAGDVPQLDGDDTGGDAESSEDLLARGRRWAAPGAEQAGDQGDTMSNGAARRAAGAPGHGVKAGHALQQARTDGTAAPGQALGELAQEMVAAQTGATLAQPARNGVVTQAVETAANVPQTASAADAATAIESAMSAAETIETAASPGGADTAGAETRDQAQPKPQSQTAQTSGPNVSVAGTDGVRFIVNSAAGSAAYTQAAPRGEEAAVLPQIVQSIRLHAVQGTTEARVQLRPEHLGNLNITLKVEQNRVTATIQADVAAVRAWIESHESSLRQALSEQGLELARLVVHPDDQQASGEEPHRDRPRRQPRRRSWRDEEATFEVLV
jgi:flagellar hook-length control protein FliK